METQIPFTLETQNSRLACPWSAWLCFRKVKAHELGSKIKLNFEF